MRLESFFFEKKKGHVLLEWKLDVQEPYVVNTHVPKFFPGLAPSLSLRGPTASAAPSGTYKYTCTPPRRSAARAITSQSVARFTVSQRHYITYDPDIGGFRRYAEPLP